MVKQWLNEYNAGLSGNSREIARLRQHRLNSLIKWRVAEIVAILPVLLQLALVLFFAGLLILLWTLHPAVGIVASVLIGALALFTLVTTALPTFYRGCSYVSPQSLGLFLLAQKARYLLHQIHTPLSNSIRKLAWSPRARRPSLRAFLFRLERLADHFFCHPRCTLSWRGREHHTLRAAGERLHVSMLATAYGTTLNPAFLATAAPACCADLRAESVVQVFARVHALHTRHWGPRHTPLLGPHRLAGTVWADVLLALLTVDPARRGAEWRSALTDVDRYLCFAGAPEDVARSDALLATLARAALHRGTAESR